MKWLVSRAHVAAWLLLRSPTQISEGNLPSAVFPQGSPDLKAEWPQRVSLAGAKKGRCDSPSGMLIL
jgi:hypothetical protein